MMVPGASWLGNLTICRCRRADSCTLSLSSSGRGLQLQGGAGEPAGGEICICGGCTNDVNICCARVGEQDNDAIAAAQRISLLILDIASMFLSFGVKMIERKILPRGCVVVD